MDRPCLIIASAEMQENLRNTRPGITTNNQRRKLYPNHDAAVMAGRPLFALLSSDFLFFSFLQSLSPDPDRPPQQASKSPDE